MRTAQSDLLEVDPLDFGPDAPATAALEAERGPEPRECVSVATNPPFAYLDSSALVS